MAARSSRNTAELIVLMLTATVCLSLLVIGAGIVVIEVVHPQADTSGGVVAISSVITTLLGALLGMIAGRSQMLTKRPDDDDDDDDDDRDPDKTTRIRARRAMYLRNNSDGGESE